MPTLLDSIAELLSREGGPLGYRTIADRLLASGAWRTKGKRPEAVVNASLSGDIANNGKRSRFQRTAKGVYALRSWRLPKFSGRRVRAKTLGSTSPARRSNAVDVKAASKKGRREVKGRRNQRTTESPSMSFTDAAERILEMEGKGEPMHYGDITTRALERGLVVTKGLTPKASMYAQIMTEIDRKRKRGETPRFARSGRGMFGLQRPGRQGLAAQIERHNETVRRDLLKQLHGMDATAFEELVGALLTRLGFDEVVVTQRSRDGGIDVRGRLVVADVIRTRMAVQVKKWNQNVQSPTVQQVRGSLGAHEQGLIITTSDFSKGAREEAERGDATPVALMNGEQFARLLIEYGIGVSRAEHLVPSIPTFAPAPHRRLARGASADRSGADRGRGIAPGESRR